MAHTRIPSRTRIAVGAATLAVAAAAVLLGGVLRDSASQAAPTASDPDAAPWLQAGFALGLDTQGLVRELQSRVRTAPQDAQSLTLLGLAYQQRARETGDPIYYAKADGVLHGALAVAPKYMLATSGLGSLALSRHEFRAALALGRDAVALAPVTARNYGIVGDALVELGRYPEAFSAFDTIARLRPSVSAYARISYARELRGDRASAISAMLLAVDAAKGQPEPMAWTRVQLGKLYWNGGRPAAAERAYREALAVFPGYVYALDQLALVEAAKGRPTRAIALERQAVDRIPLPQFVSTLGDLYAARGQHALAAKQVALIGVINKLLAANGVRTDLESTLYDVDHGTRLSTAVARARAARADRPSIDGDDVLGWALTRTGRCAEGLAWARRSLRLGTQDPLKVFHLGMAQRCAGQPAAARASFRRALVLNPHFSVLWAPAARAGSAGTAAVAPLATTMRAAS